MDQHAIQGQYKSLYAKEIQLSYVRPDGQLGSNAGLTLLTYLTTYFCIIFQVLLQYPKLKILYLHANSIEKLSEVDKLAELPELIGITLHGNPIETLPGYKQHIISTLPKLKTLDFIPITNKNRSDAQLWRDNFKKRQFFQIEKGQIKFELICFISYTFIK